MNIYYFDYAPDGNYAIYNAGSPFTDAVETFGFSIKYGFVQQRLKELNNG